MDGFTCSFPTTGIASITFLQPSTVAQLLGAHLENRKVHTLSSVVEHRALTTHNDPARHWAGDHGDPEENRAARIASAIQEINDANGAYIDVHAWYFTPQSFRQVITDLSATKHISFLGSNNVSHAS